MMTPLQANQKPTGLRRLIGLVLLFATVGLVSWQALLVL